MKEAPHAKSDEILCWSPNDQILLVMFENGRAFFLDSQFGKVLYTADLPLLKPGPRMIRWVSLMSPKDLYLACAENIHSSPKVMLPLKSIKRLDCHFYLPIHP